MLRDLLLGSAQGRFAGVAPSVEFLTLAVPRVVVLARQPALPQPIVDRDNFSLDEGRLPAQLTEQLRGPVASAARTFGLAAFAHAQGRRRALRRGH